MATRRITIEVEVPEGISEEDFKREARRQLARLTLLMALETLQRQAPTEEEINDLAREIKRKAYSGRA